MFECFFIPLIISLIKMIDLMAAKVVGMKKIQVGIRIKKVGIKAFCRADAIVGRMREVSILVAVLFSVFAWRGAKEPLECPCEC